MRRLTVLFAGIVLGLAAVAQNVTVNARRVPAENVFQSIMCQTGMNFIYSSSLLDGITVTVEARDLPIEKVLERMFRATDIEWRIRGKDVVLKRRKKTVEHPRLLSQTPAARPTVDGTHLLDEVVVVSRLDEPSVTTAEIGSMKLTQERVLSVPALFGESDVIKSLHTQPGVSEGAEGMAGMYVHGGNADENLYMLDNVPLYQVNHFAGLFSAFNPRVIRYIDFFRSSVPAKYDGRLSSFMDVRTLDGGGERLHGSARLGLTSGEVDIHGPIGSRTGYMVALRRSWYDVLTAPVLALANASQADEKIRFGYSFMDFNARLSHRFDSLTNAFVSIYFGDDRLRTGTKDIIKPSTGGWFWDDRYDFQWGNLVVQAGVNRRFSPRLTSEFTLAYTRYFSGMHRDERITEISSSRRTETRQRIDTDNNINDWIARADFDWRPDQSSRVRFGASFTMHSFLPSRTSRLYSFEDDRLSVRDSISAYRAGEINLYIEDDWRLTGSLRIQAGLHASLFAIERRVRHGLSPRLSVGWHLSDSWAVKGAYSHTVQYVHQLTQSYLSLPSDQWIPITGNLKPQTADKISAGIYWQSSGGTFAASAEAYWKRMSNLVDYRDEYYLTPPLEQWNARLTSGDGSARGIDFKIEKSSGRLTGHVAYSLAWADRTFAGRNGGRRFPARFDNRHTLKLLLDWRVSDRVSLNALWTGHSGNRFTLMTQVWSAPEFGNNYIDDADPLKVPVNNYRLPFYHRLDLSCTVKNRRGYWTFSAYNAYCHMNTVAIVRDYDRAGTPVFKRFKMLPVIPSVSYTWLF